ncbi:MAG TPA: hypothetical protein VGF75_03745 [Candidatus Saccharimonadales bacterium]|jgi:hypothetical protein
MKKHHKLSHKLTELSAGILIVVFGAVVIGGIVYGIHYLNKTSPNSKVSTQTSAKSNSSTSSTSPYTPGSTAAGSKQSSNNSNNQLANTGPGKEEFIIFGVASLSGSLIYYIWRIKFQN